MDRRLSWVATAGRATSFSLNDPRPSDASVSMAFMDDRVMTQSAFTSWGRRFVFRVAPFSGSIQRVPWGNVRELERLIERVVALARTNRIDLDDLPPQVRGQYGEVLAPALAANDSMRAWASRYARLVFERCGRNKRQASRLLDISYHTLDAYLRYGNTGSRPAGKRCRPGRAKNRASLPSPLGRLVLDPSPSHIVRLEVRTSAS